MKANRLSLALVLLLTLTTANAHQATPSAGTNSTPSHPASKPVDASGTNNGPLAETNQSKSTGSFADPISAVIPAKSQTALGTGGQTNEDGKVINQTVEETRTKAEQGEAAAQYQLAFDYYVGQFLPQDYAEAVKWYRKAAEQGMRDAQCNVGVCYMEGKGEHQDYEEGVKWLRKAAEASCPEAQVSLGTCFSQGKGVPRDYYEAAKWFRKAAEQGHLHAQCDLGWCYHEGNGVAKDYAEAARWFRKAAEKDYPDGQLLMGVAYAAGEGVKADDREAAKWYRRAAEQGQSTAQLRLGVCYFDGKGVPQDDAQAVTWLQKAAEKGVPSAQSALGSCYITGRGVLQDWSVGVRWLRKGAEQGEATGQCGLGVAYFMGQGVPEDYLEAYKWLNLAAAQGDTNTIAFRDQLRGLMTPEQIAEGQRRASAFQPRFVSGNASEFVPSAAALDFAPTSSGTGFFITEDGFLVTNEHVVKNATEIRLLTSAGAVEAKIVSVDDANDLALLKAVGVFRSLAITPSRSVKMGSTVTTVGFPNIGLQGFAPKFAKGEIAALSGAKDDPKYFQISVPVQPGNSGGALVDERGNVVGVVSAKLSVGAALATSGSLPENVNYAIKSSFLLSFLESVPELTPKLKEPSSKAQKLEDVVSSAEHAAALVMCREPAKTPAPITFQALPLATYASSDHTIEKVLDDGNFIKLEDGSLWQVSPFDASDSSSWTESSEITIIKVDDSAYPYKLINTDDNESVRARRVQN